MLITINLIYQLNWYVNISFYNHWFGCYTQCPSPTKTCSLKSQDVNIHFWVSCNPLSPDIRIIKIILLIEINTFLFLCQTKERCVCLSPIVMPFCWWGISHASQDFFQQKQQLLSLKLYFFLLFWCLSRVHAISPYCPSVEHLYFNSSRQCFIPRKEVVGKESLGMNTFHVI